MSSNYLQPQIMSSVIIRAGINPSTGDLEVSKAAESFIGGQKYQCSCGDEESCYVINGELRQHASRVVW